MRKFFAILLFLFANKLFAQVAIINKSLPQVLVRGIPNKLKVSVCNAKYNDIIVRVSIGEIMNIGNGFYIYNLCEGYERDVWMYVYNKSRLIDSVHYLIERIPNPKIMTGFNDSIYASSSQVGVRIDFQENYLDTLQKGELLKYDVFVTQLNGSKFELTINSRYFTKEFVSILNKLNVGDRVELKNFIVQIGCETSTRKIDKILTYYFAKGSQPIRW